MKRLLLRGADVVVTMDATRREIRGGSVVVEDRVIACVGSTAEVAAWIAADPARAPTETIELKGCVLMPGMVNGHHHLYQTLTR